MMWRGPRRIMLLLVALLLVLSACTGSQRTGVPARATKLKIAMILPGTVEDADYNFVGYQALEELKKAYQAEVKHQEKVAPADAERVARGFINDGFNVIAFHGGQFVTTVQKLAVDFPEVNFIMESAGPMEGLPANVWNIGRKFYEGFYALGALGARATKSGKVGIVAGIKLPDFIASINAVQDAVREIKPEVKVLHTFVGDQNNPVVARQAAEAMLNEGADFIILLVNLGASGVVEAVKDMPVLLTTYYTDKTEMAPKNFTGSLLLDFSVPYKNVVGQIQVGKRSGYEEMRPGNGMSLSALKNVPEAVSQEIGTIFAQVAAKKLVIKENGKDVVVAQ